MNELSQTIEDMRTMRESYDQLGAAAEAYNTGKVQLAANITSKGVSASASETLPELADKVSAIAQQPIILSPSEVGDMYAVQQFGSLTTPNYWNLYEVLNTLLNDGRLLNYGGILLAEYYKGYDSLALSGAGTGGAYVVSDMENGQFKMYTEDTTHTWATEFDGKATRWVAYCFAGEYHDFQITDTNTSPRGIFIGRKVGTITSVVNGRVSQIVVPDGSELRAFDTGTYTQFWEKNVVVRNLGDTFGTTLLYNSNCESIYIKADRILANRENGVKSLIIERNTNNLRSIIIECPYIKAGQADSGGSGDPSVLFSFDYMQNNLSYLAFKNCEYLAYTFNPVRYNAKLKYLKNLDIIGTEYCSISGNTNNGSAVAVVNISYITNDKSKSVSLSGSMFANTTDVVLQDGWNKPLIVSTLNSLTEENMYAHILQRLKQDEPDCGDGVTITLGSTNLAKLTSEESVQLLDDLTNIYGYTFA